MDVFATMRGLCSRRKVSPGQLAEPMLGPLGQLMLSQLRPSNADMAERAKLFLGSTPAAGVTIPIFSNTTQQFVLFNPPNSGKKAAIIKSVLGYVSGTMVAGHYCYANNTLPTSAVSGTPALVQRAGLALAAAANAGNVCSLFTAATVVALTYLFPFGVSQVVQPATGVNTPWQMVDNLDGAIVVYPGQCLAIAANVAAACVATAGLMWEETDLDE